MKKPTEFQIRTRWKWDKIKATPSAIRLAVKRTQNPYGITVCGVPYVAPKIGLRVETWHGQGAIVEVRKPMQKGGDPEVKIERDCGGFAYLFQTAICGYRVIKAANTSPSRSPRQR